MTRRAQTPVPVLQRMRRRLRHVLTCTPETAAPDEAVPTWDPHPYVDCHRCLLLARPCTDASDRRCTSHPTWRRTRRKVRHRHVRRGAPTTTTAYLGRRQAGAPVDSPILP